jgi:serine/threonine protein kinase
VKAVKKVTKRDKYNLLRRGVAEDDNTLWSIQREIAIMKRCRHANVVRLVEIIDDPSADKIYISGYFHPPLDLCKMSYHL